VVRSLYRNCTALLANPWTRLIVLMAAVQAEIRLAVLGGDLAHSCAVKEGVAPEGSKV
jgi:hypothetical protein